MILARSHDDAFQACQRAALDVYLRTDGQERRRPCSQARTEDSPDRRNLLIFDWDGRFASPYNADHAGRGQDGQQAIARVKPAEHIAGKKREFQYFDPVGPLPPAVIERKKLFIALSVQGGGGYARQSGLDLNSVPR